MTLARTLVLAVLLLALAVLPFGGAPVSPAIAQTSAAVTAEQKRLEEELKKVEAEIARQTVLLQGKQKETASIQRDVDILTAEIKQAKLKIQAKEIEIKRLGSDIGKKETVILTLSERIEREKESMSELLRKTREVDETSLPEIVLANNSLSELFRDFDTFSTVQLSLHQSFEDIRSNKQKTETEKVQLTTRRSAEIDARAEIEKQKRTIEAKEDEKQNLLRVSKGQENSYKAVLAERERERQAIRSALFRLRGATNISFGEALDYANVVAKATGIRPAFLLAIITQESNLGENIGTCNRPGDPPEKSWREIMKPTRDYEPYLAITKELGLDPDTMPLSCPYGGGYGGAMGPAQFIPSTWISYKDKIARATGNNPPSPWNPQDAFAASGIYLTELGAGAKTYTAERTAALRYYAGGNWSAPQNAFYGDSVMNIATQYQTQIDILQKN